MRSVFLAQLSRKIRAKLGLSQEGLARALSISKGSVQHWESGRRRPSPPQLRKLAEVAPAFAEELAREIEKFEWHPGQAGRIGERELHELPPDIDEALENLSKKHGLDTSVILIQALRTGLAALSRDSSPDWKTLVKRQADIARRVEDREHPADSSRKRRRSKVA